MVFLLILLAMCLQIGSFYLNIPPPLYQCLHIGGFAPVELWTKPVPVMGSPQKVTFPPAAF